MSKEDSSNEAWVIWATNMKLLKDIHLEIDEGIKNKNALIYSDDKWLEEKEKAERGR